MNAQLPTPAPVVDWDSIGELGFEVAERVAPSVARAYAAIEEDDVYQECLIYMATHTEELDRLYQSGFDFPGVQGGRLGGRKAMIRHMTSRMKRWAAQQIERRGLEVVAAGRHQAKLDTSRWSNQSTPTGFSAMPYSPALIEALLPSTWNLADLTSATSEGMPDPDMPRASSDPSHAGTHMAHYADIRDAWANAPLTGRGRQALLLRYGLEYTRAEIAEILEIDLSGVGRHINRALEAITTHLNGKEISLEGEYEDAAA